MPNIKLPDQYTIFARYCPAIVCSIPIFYGLYFCGKQIMEVFSLMDAAVGAAGISLALVFVYAMAQFTRFLGKMVVERAFFSDETWMPTTNLLLYKNKGLSKEYKEKIRAKIESTFSLTLCTAAQERNNEQSARQKITEAVALVRKATPASKILLQYNIEYGAGRNLIGGSIIALGVLVAELIAQRSHPGLFPMDHLIFMIVAYGSVPLISPWIMKTLGGLYAKSLFQEFLVH